MPFGYSLWVWFRGNKWAQIVLGVGVAYMLMRAKEEIDERRGYKRAEQRITKKARKVQKVIEGESHEKSEAAETARNRVLDNPVPDKLPDGFLKRSRGG